MSTFPKEERERQRPSSESLRADLEWHSYNWRSHIILIFVVGVSKSLLLKCCALVFEAKASFVCGMVFLCFTRAGASGASQHATDMHLQSAYGEYAARMQTGRDPVHSSDKPRDFPDRCRTTTCSLFSSDSQCAGWKQTFRVGLRDGTRDKSTCRSHCCRNLANS